MYDVFELIESELGLDWGTLYDEIAEDSEKVKNNLMAAGLFNQDVLLAMDLNQKGSSAPLLTKGTNLWENIGPVLKRIANNPDSIERPKVAATDEVNVYLKKKIINHIESMKENILKSTKFNRIYSEAKKDKSLKQVLDSLGEIIDKYLSKPETISRVFKALNDKHSVSLLEESVNAACISMFTLKNRNDFAQYSDVSRNQLINVGSAALFRDISRIFYPNNYPIKDTKGHSEKSAEIAQDLGLDTDIICVIKYHHIINNRLCRKTENEQLYKEIIDVVELFMDLMSNKNFSENEIIIALNNLAYNGLLEINTE